MEEELVLACRGGDKGAYASLVRTHTRSIFAICLGMLGNVHDAEDAAQETFVRAFGQIGRVARRFAVPTVGRADRPEPLPRSPSSPQARFAGARDARRRKIQSGRSRQAA